jgi:hypothetical protein
LPAGSRSLACRRSVSLPWRCSSRLSVVRSLSLTASYGETRTRTGDTTIFSESSQAIPPDEMPAKWSLCRAAALLPCLRLARLRAGLGLHRARRAPIEAAGPTCCEPAVRRMSREVPEAGQGSGGWSGEPRASRRGRAGPCQRPLVANGSTPVRLELVAVQFQTATPPRWPRPPRRRPRLPRHAGS